MPQMSPMMWMFIGLITQLLLLLIFSFNFFFKFININNKKVSLTNNFILLW